MQTLKYQAASGLMLRVTCEQATVWLTAEQIGQLYSTTKQNVGKHLKFLRQSGEITEDDRVNFSFTDSSGRLHHVAHYNLAMIIAVGFRVHSPEATAFRRSSRPLHLTHT